VWFHFHAWIPRNRAAPLILCFVSLDSDKFIIGVFVQRIELYSLTAADDESVDELNRFRHLSLELWIALAPLNPIC
jgi:hypothetical protein